MVLSYPIFTYGGKTSVFTNRLPCVLCQVAVCVGDQFVSCSLVSVCLFPTVRRLTYPFFACGCLCLCRSRESGWNVAGKRFVNVLEASWQFFLSDSLCLHQWPWWLCGGMFHQRCSLFFLAGFLISWCYSLLQSVFWSSYGTLLCMLYLPYDF